MKKSPYNEIIPTIQCPCGKMLLEKETIKVVGEFNGGVYRVGLCQDCAERVLGFYKAMEKAHQSIIKKKHGK